MHCSDKTPSSNNTREDSTHGHHQMANTKIRLMIFFAAKDGEALYSQQKQDQELTVAQIRTPYCQIQNEIEESLSSVVAVSIYIPTSSASGSPFLHTLSRMYCL